MTEQMDCMKYREHLNEWIDGELPEELERAMQAHMQACPECAEETRLLRETAEFIRSLEADIPVPLQTQSAWRKAVRAEAKQRRSKPRFTAAFRAIGSVAAAFVVLAGCTGVFRMNGMLNPASPVTTAVEQSADAGAVPLVAAARSAGQTSAKMESRAIPMTFIASDGAVNDESIAVISDTAEQSEPAPDATPAPLLVRSVERTIVTENFDGASQNIRDLTEQYGGYLSNDAATTAANGVRVGEFTAVIPAVETDSFLQMIDHVGNVTYTAEHLDDISSAVQDVQSRLDALMAEQARLNELIPAAADADELARLSTLMQATLTEIDSAQSESNRLQSELENVRVSIRLEELYATATLSPTSVPELTQRMGSAFSRSAQNLQSFVQDMAVTLMLIAPFLLPVLAAAAVVTAIVLVIRRKR